MKQNTLIGNTEFGKKLNEDYLKGFYNLTDYQMLRSKMDNFLSKTPELWMFVPCKFENGQWVVLEPYQKTEAEIYADENSMCRIISKQEIEYSEAKAKCYFEWFVCVYQDKFVKTASKGKERGALKINFKTKNVFVHRDKFIVKTLEDLVKYNLTLTPTALKELGRVENDKN